MDDFAQFNADLDNHHTAVLKLLKQIEAHAEAAGNEKLLAIIRQHNTEVNKTAASLHAKSVELYSSVQKKVEQKTLKLEKEIEALKKVKDALVADNLLLEYKKKDLLLLTSRLEETNEEISIKNKELTVQQQKIIEQADRLNAIHKEILEKHQLLEQQKEALLDQSDYLHEANQTITMMHEEVQKQKNEILQKNEELLNLNTEKNNLIGIVAHDLKSPLNQMRGLISLIKLSSSNLDKETVSCLEMMEKSAERLTDLIAKILDVEAIESKQLNLIIETVNVSELLQAITERYRMQASQKFIHLHTSIDPEIYVMADKIYLSQIFDNLISNAIKFSPANKTVHIKLMQFDGKAVTEVNDEGPGLSEDDKKKLFGKYQKLSARPTGNETSTGLGLSIVKKFVEAMNGRIWCESELGSGASFFVAFPRQKQ